MKQRKKHKGVQGHALLYGRSSRAIRIVNGKVAGKVENVEEHHYAPKKKNGAKKQVQKKHRMSEEIQRRLDNLQDPMDIMSRNLRAQKYEVTKSREEYEYGLSDW